MQRTHGSQDVHSSAVAGALMVLAKIPIAGRAKTRLCPPLSASEAAEVAEAALVDTLHAVLKSNVERRVLVLDRLDDKTPLLEFSWWNEDFARGFTVIEQGTGGLDERLTKAFDDAGMPAFLVAMDTPQLTTELLRSGLLSLQNHDASIGFAEDGGYWGIGLRRADAANFIGVPMSQDHTGQAQIERLYQRGLTVAELSKLRDVDTFDDAVAVAAEIPDSQFANVLNRIRA